MLFNRTTYLGIDPTLSRLNPVTARRRKARQAFVYAAIDRDLEIVALSEGSLEELLAFVAGQESAFVAVNAPSRPNQGLMERDELREMLVPPPKPGRWQDFRLAEYQLRQHRIGVTATPHQTEKCPWWVKSGFEVYHHLCSLGYKPFPAGDEPLQWLEVHPHASCCALLGQAPFPKRSLEGRLQRQLLLREEGLGVPDPMRFFEEVTPHKLLKGFLPVKDIYSALELDALIAAYTAWMAATHPEQITLLGDPDEGQVVVPAAELRERY